MAKDKIMALDLPEPVHDPERVVLYGGSGGGITSEETPWQT